MSSPLVSLVILNWNGKTILGKCLESLKIQTYKNWELILIDNASTDGSVEIAREKFPWSKIIELRQNLGFAKGNNIGIRESSGKYVILLNNDTEVKPTFIETLVSEAERDSSIASVGCKVLQYDGSIKYCPIYTVEGGFLFHRRISGFMSKNPVYIQHFDHRASVVANVGCAVLYRKTAIGEVGAFDPFYSSNWEDNDLGLRLNIAGFTVCYVPHPLVQHVGGASEGSWLSFNRFSLVVRNTMITYYANFELIHATVRTFVVSVIMLSDGLLKWATRNTQSRTAFPILAGYLKSLVSFVFNFRIIQRKRLCVQQKRRVSDKYLAQKTNIENVMA